MLHSFMLALVAVFVALDIVGTLPLYVSLTDGMTPAARKHTVDTSMIVALTVALVFVFLGQTIFTYLGISIFDFKIAGGIVLLLISLADLVGGPEVRHKTPTGAGIVPLAVPLITGPGVLTTLVLQVGAFGYLITLGALFVNYTCAWFLLRKAQMITGRIGNTGTTVISKIAALLLAAIAVAMIRSGFFDAVTAYNSLPK
jgi:multiple antibiotic resistance protein